MKQTIPITVTLDTDTVDLDRETGSREWWFKIDTGAAQPITVHAYGTLQQTLRAAVDTGIEWSEGRTVKAIKIEVLTR